MSEGLSASSFPEFLSSLHNLHTAPSPSTQLFPFCSSSQLFMCERHLNTLLSDRKSEIPRLEMGMRKGRREGGDDHRDWPLLLKSRGLNVWIQISKWSVSLQNIRCCKKMTTKYQGPTACRSVLCQIQAPEGK